MNRETVNFIMNFDFEKYSQQVANRSYCSLKYGSKIICNLQLKENKIFTTPEKIIIINQIYKNTYKNMNQHSVEFRFEPRHLSVTRFTLDECIIDGQKKDIMMSQISKLSLGKIADDSEINITFEIEVDTSNPIFLSLDLETEEMLYKVGHTIFDLAILAYYQKETTIVFESNKWFNFTIRKPLEFEDYALVMFNYTA